MSNELKIQKFLLISDSKAQPSEELLEKDNGTSAPFLRRLFPKSLLNFFQKPPKPHDWIDNYVTAVDVDQVAEFQRYSHDPCSYRYTEHTTPGYFVFSTAPFNTEDGEAELMVDMTPVMREWRKKDETKIADQEISGRRGVTIPVRSPKLEQKQLEKVFKEAVGAIAQDLKLALESGETPELVIAIHGFSTEQNNTRKWYKKIFHYVNHDPRLKDRKNLVFIGYRWSSESVGRSSFSLEGLGTAFKALPILLQILMGVGGVGLLLGLLWVNIAMGQWTRFVASFLILAATSVTFILLCLVILRIIVYFRDHYRASNFAVPDLVELIRKLNAELETRGYPEDKDINLNFIAHSMGGFVATNTIRILSDVFAPNAVNKKPDSKIGRVFCLKRLILASPDISALAIASRRANFLASSLRRVDEAYLFSNEGDLALRLASTAANYFSFPARTRNSGYRLGNVSLSHQDYGIVNLEGLKGCCSGSSNLLFEKIPKVIHCLFISKINWDKRQHSRDKNGASNQASLADLADELVSNDPQNDLSIADSLSIADLFTYIDCTDYLEIDDTAADWGLNQSKIPLPYANFLSKFKVQDCDVRAVGILSRAKGVRASRRPQPLGIWDYPPLLIDFLQGRDVHGGYFVAPFSQKLIYHLAFTGFHDFLGYYQSDDVDDNLKRFSEDCQKHCLQVWLASLHYKSAYIQGAELNKIKADLIDYITQK